VLQLRTVTDIFKIQNVMHVPLKPDTWIGSSGKLLNLKCTHTISTEKMSRPYANLGSPFYTSLRKGDSHL